MPTNYYSPLPPPPPYRFSDLPPSLSECEASSSEIIRREEHNRGYANVSFKECKTNQCTGDAIRNSASASVDLTQLLSYHKLLGKPKKLPGVLKEIW